MLTRNFRTIWWIALVASCLPASATVQSSQQPEPATQQQAPTAPNPARPPHQIKIWTNEDLLETRTPADRYIFAKEEKDAADRAAEFQSITSCFAPDNHEPTAEETQKEISNTTKAIADAEEGVAQARRQLAEDPENLRTRDQAELNRRTAELNRLLEHLHTLQTRRQETAPQPSPPAAPDVSPSPPPAPVSEPLPQ